MRPGGRLHRLWLWWWDLPGSHWWFPYTVAGHEMIWSVNAGGPVAWPGRIRCLLRPHSDDGYDCCVYCGHWPAGEGTTMRDSKVVPVLGRAADKIEQLTATCKRQLQRERWIIGSALTGRPGTLFGVPVKLSVEWPEGPPSGMTEDDLRAMGESMCSGLGDDGDWNRAG